MCVILLNTFRIIKILLYNISFLQFNFCKIITNNKTNKKNLRNILLSIKFKVPYSVAFAE